MIAEQIPLVIQQAKNLKMWCTPFTSTAAFALGSGTQGPSVGAYGSFNPVPGMCNGDKSSQWRDFLSSNDLFIFTPATLVNLLLAVNPHDFKLDYFIIDEAHHTVKEHPFRTLMAYIEKSGHKAERPRILGVTATIGGSLDLNRSEGHLKELAKNLDCEVFSEYCLSQKAREELSSVVAKITPTELIIETSELESWFETKADGLARNLKDRIQNLNYSKKMKDLEGESSAQEKIDNEIKVLSVFADHLDEANKIANDCGIGQAMIWLSSEYLSSMCENHSHQDFQNFRLLAWVELRFMLSGIFSDLSNVFLDVQKGIIDEQGTSNWNMYETAVTKDPLERGIRNVQISSAHP